MKSPGTVTSETTLDQGTMSFTVEGRLLRELGERLVKQPEVALLELVKNAYDADASICRVRLELPKQIVISDDGHGMTLEEFANGWMRIGTSTRAASPLSRQFGRQITGEKGIGRFSVRFLGRQLHLQSVAFDESRNMHTLISADFDWRAIDQYEDIGQVKVPYRLEHVDENSAIGTSLFISDLRTNVTDLDMRFVRTASIGIVTPYRSLVPRSDRKQNSLARREDPGFSLRLGSGTRSSGDEDLARAMLNGYVLRAVVELQGDRLKLAVYRRGSERTVIDINDRYENSLGTLYADIRFFPKRKGTFTGLPVDGRRARTWVKDNSGVAVFDRTFRVYPYGADSDDWLSLAADAAKRARDPSSSIARRHFPMDAATHSSTQLNYMLRLPYPRQLVGSVQVAGRRGRDQEREDAGLVAAADREGFVDNAAFRELRDIVRGAIEAIASADRQLQQEQDRAEQEELLRTLRREVRDAIREIQVNPNIGRAEKNRLIAQLATTQNIAERHEERAEQRATALETMSLLGVVAGFMTHEFGAAFDELGRCQQILDRVARHDTSMKSAASALKGHRDRLREFVTYSQGYIKGTSSRPSEAYAARPRIQQIVRVFGTYASDRGIEVEVGVERDVMAPLVPVSLYSGVILNLFTNALKAVTASTASGRRCIAFRAWNQEKIHVLEVSDTGIGIPTPLRRRIFDALFTTTASNRDPLGSGMGLGLSLVKRGIEAFNGNISVVEPPPEFATCFRVVLPLEAKA